MLLGLETPRFLGVPKPFLLLKVRAFTPEFLSSHRVLKLFLHGLKLETNAYTNRVASQAAIHQLCKTVVCVNRKGVKAEVSLKVQSYRIGV